MSLSSHPYQQLATLPWFQDAVHQAMTAPQLCEVAAAHGYQIGETTAKKARRLVLSGGLSGSNPCGNVATSEGPTGEEEPSPAGQSLVATLPQETASRAPQGDVLEWDEASERGTLLSRSERIRTLEQLLEHAGTDLAVWEVERHVLNSWEVGAKGPDGRILTAPLFQVKAWLVRRRDAVRLRAIKDDLLLDAKGWAPRYPRVRHKAKPDAHLLALGIPDLHLGKLCWPDETGHDAYDVEIASRVYRDAVRDLLRLASPFPVERVLLPVGNDFLNIDRGLAGASKHTTTSGTAQDEDGRWQRSFRVGRQLLCETIDLCQELAPVEVVVVPGNHDSEKMWTLGEVLGAWYRNCPSTLR